MGGRGEEGRGHEISKIPSLFTILFQYTSINSCKLYNFCSHCRIVKSGLIVNRRRVSGLLRHYHHTSGMWPRDQVVSGESHGNRSDVEDKDNANEETMGRVRDV